MNTLVMVAALAALLALTAVAIRAYLLIGRVHQLVDSEVSATIRSLEETVQGVRRTAGKLDDNLESLGTTLARVERLTATLEPDALARTVAQPALRTLASWLRGLRRGLESVRGEHPRLREAKGEDESEAG